MMTKPGPAIERRFAPLSEIEVRADDETKVVHFRGHAAVFNQMTEIAGLWREQIAPGTFKKTLKDGADVRFLWNHNPETVMARTKSGNLKLAEDKAGLDTRADLDSSDWDVQRILPKLKRGDVTQMSFAFRAITSEWNEEPEDKGLPIRTIKEVQLFDVSPVTYPAYEGTDAELVSIRALAATDPLVKQMLEAKTGEPESEVETEGKSDSPDEDKDSSDEDGVDTSESREENASTEPSTDDKPEPSQTLHLAHQWALRRERLAELEKTLKE